jgi:SAM-dependent methyltransferase
VSFAVTADAYDRFMGRYSGPLASVLADYAGVVAGQRVLDVGCGPGAMTAELVGRLGAGSVAAVDPSPPFVAAMAERFPAVELHKAPAEQLPFDDRSFDAALAELVVHFMRDPVVGLSEMARVTRPGGVVAACVWDHAGGGSPLGLFWEAVHELDPVAVGEEELAGARQGHLGELFRAAGLTQVEESALSVTITHATFDEWWEPYTLGVGPAGAYVASLDAAAVAALRDRCRQLHDEPPFGVTAVAWAARGVVSV